jgi:hypothetical protein
VGEQKRRKFKIDWNDHKVASLSMCTNCGYEMDTASGVTHKEAPKPGAISICLKCSHIMAFGDGLKLRNLTDQEMEEVAGHPELLFLIRGLGMARVEYEKEHGEGSWAKKKK